MIDNQKLISDLMNRMAEIDVKSKDKYELDGKRIPRVTEILSAMLHEDSLLSWSNGLGWKRISYRAFMKEAAEKGTYSHLAIEKYLRNGFVDLNEMKIPSNIIFETVRSTMDGFMEWWKILHKNHKSIEVVFLEETLLHKYFGGTCDCLLKVDDKYWLIDFKTSNHMSYNYALQLAAYRFLLRELKGIIVSNCMVLLLDKTNHSYKTYELHLDENPSHLQFIQDAEQTFMLLSAAFRARLYTTEEYYKAFEIKPYKKEE